MLKNHGYIRTGLRDRSSVYHYFAAIAGNQTIDDAQKCSLAATARTQDANAFVCLDFEIDVVQRDDIAAAVSFRQISNDDLGHAEIKLPEFPRVV